MAISNYSELRDAVVDWSHRPDLAVRIDDFIKMAEQFMYSNSIEPLQATGIETSSTATIDEKTESLPTGFISMRSVELSVNNQTWKLFSRTPETIESYGQTGTPNQYAVSGTNIIFDKTPDQDYTATYYYFARPTGISSSNTTNTILTNNPDIYLYGCLWASSIWTKDQEAKMMYQGLFIESIKGANEASNLQRMGSSPEIIVNGMVV